MEMELRSVRNPLNELVLAQSEQVLLRDFFMEENWKPIPNCKGYEVSNLGNVRTNLPRNRHSTSREYRPIKQSSLKTGYKRFSASLNGLPKNVLVHRAVLEAFKGACPDGYNACHNNGDCTDNNIDNLRWDTKSNNSKDVVTHGRNNLAKLNWDLVYKIRSLKGIKTQKSLSKEFGVCLSTIGSVLREVTWKDNCQEHLKRQKGR